MNVSSKQKKKRVSREENNFEEVCGSAAEAMIVTCDRTVQIAESKQR